MAGIHEIERPAPPQLKLATAPPTLSPTASVITFPKRPKPTGDLRSQLKSEVAYFEQLVELNSWQIHALEARLSFS